MPETAYQRTYNYTNTTPEDPNTNLSSNDTPKTRASHTESTNAIPEKKTYAQSMNLFNPNFTNESLLTLFWRPIPLLFLPSVLWGTLAMSVSIGTFVAISSNFATAFSQTYNFSTWQCGMTYVAVLIGALSGVYGGGWLSDKVADWLTQRKDGIREPEMRLPTVSISLVFCPVSLVLYGVGMQYSLHWIVPVLGLGLCERTYLPTYGYGYGFEMGVSANQLLC